MNSKQKILSAIRNCKPPATDLAPEQLQAMTFDDPYAEFASVLDSVGGNAIRVTDQNALKHQLADLPVVRSAVKIYSTVPELLAPTIDPAEIARPHDLQELDLCVATGSLAVAENAAVWVTDRQLPHRVVYFIAEHLVLIVPATAIRNNLHEAYAELEFTGPGYGLFISGPSKTADIEQSLVFGAQGPRSLTVFVVDRWPAG
jgi:L-lactate dehydrogenase complex protein LldG